jgi:hypothetical protein
VAQSSGALDRTTGLEHDLTLMQGLVQAWPSDEARRVVLKALSSQPGGLDAVLAVRSAEAFDDLVMLLGILDHLDSMPDEGLSMSAASAASAVTVAPAPSQSSSAPAAATVQDDLDTEFLSWQSVASIPLAPAPKPALDFELPLQVAPVSDSKAPPAPPAPPATPPVASPPLDFDFGSLELEPKAPPVAPKGSDA